MGLEECGIGRVWDWKGVRLEGCRIGRLLDCRIRGVQDWKSVGLEECRIRMCDFMDYIGSIIFLLFYRSFRFRACQ